MKVTEGNALDLRHHLLVVDHLAKLSMPTIDKPFVTERDEYVVIASHRLDPLLCGLVVELV
ncbi:hypothetical protein D3C71_1799590 [compost metagenome]